MSCQAHVKPFHIVSGSFVNKRPTQTYQRWITGWHLLLWIKYIAPRTNVLHKATPSYGKQRIILADLNLLKSNQVHIVRQHSSLTVTMKVIPHGWLYSFNASHSWQGETLNWITKTAAQHDAMTLRVVCSCYGNYCWYVGADPQPWGNNTFLPFSVNYSVCSIMPHNSCVLCFSALLTQARSKDMRTWYVLAPSPIAWQIVGVCLLTSADALVCPGLYSYVSYTTKRFSPYPTQSCNLGFNLWSFNDHCAWLAPPLMYLFTDRSLFDCWDKNHRTACT